MVKIIGAGSVIEAEAVAEHPIKSVTVTLYAPAETLIEDAVDALDQL